MAIVCLLLLDGTALAGARVALVVGNAHYASFGPLSTPLNDATDIAAELTNSGFKVITATDVDERAFIRQIAAFSTLAEGADIAVFYYGGHGLQFQSENYLMPVDAALENKFSLTHETVALSEVVFAASKARAALIYVDACRSFPDSQTFFARPNERVVRVLGPAPFHPDADTFVGFSASPGQTAQDGTGRNSPFAKAMLQFLPVPGLALSELFGRVAQTVKTETDGAQRPQSYGTVAPELTLVAAVAAPPPVVAPPGADERAYEAALRVGTAGAWNAYLHQFPSGFYASLAQEELAKLAGHSSSSWVHLPPIPVLPGSDSPVARCDALAGDPTDPKHIGSGVAYERVDASLAVPACLAATTAQPDEPRLRYQYGRALMVADKSADALAAFRSAADAGYAEAITSVARAVRDGDAVERDVPAAIALLKKAAAAGSSNAMASLGVIYSKGSLAPRDDDVAFQWYQQAAKLNNALGLTNLGSMYRDGRGVPRNFQTAVTLYEKAVNLDYPSAMYALAGLLDDGVGVPRDGQRASALLVRALTLDPDLYDVLVGTRSDLSQDTVRSLQLILQQRGTYVGAIDGKFGKETRAALSALVGQPSSR